MGLIPLREKVSKNILLSQLHILEYQKLCKRNKEKKTKSLKRHTGIRFPLRVVLYEAIPIVSQTKRWIR